MRNISFNFILMKKISFIFLIFLSFSNVTFSQSIKEFKEKLKVEKRLLQQSKIHADIGYEYFQKGNFTEALQHFFESLKIAQKINNKFNIAKAYQNIGVTYRENEKYKEAENYLKKALEIFTQLNEPKDMGNCFHSLGNLYYMQYLDSLSEVYFNKAIKHYNISGDSLSLINAYNSLGALYFEMGDTLKGTSIMKKSLNYLLLDDTLQCFKVYLSLAELYTYSGALIEARIYLDSCLRLLPNIKATHLLVDYYYMLHYYHKEKGNYIQSLEDYKRYVIYKDSVLNKDTQKQIDELNIKYKTEKKEQQIKYLNAKNSNNVLTIAKQRWFIFSVLLSVLVLLIIAYSLFRRYKMKIARQKELDLEKQKELERKRIARDMHDEIGAGITRISINNEQLKFYLKDEAGSEAYSYLDKVEFESKQLSRNIGEIIWGLNPKNDNLETLCAYIRSYMYDFLDEAGIKAIIDFPQEISDQVLSPEFRRNVFLVVKEALNNCVKYSNATEAKLSITILNDKMTLTFSDNGKGFDLNSHRLGNGLTNMESRTKDIQGIFELYSAPGKGVEIRMKELTF